MPKLYIETYGCTLNRADSDAIAGMLLARGFSLTQSESTADLIVINTCTVKGPTENKILSRLKRIKCSGKPTIVTGCLAINQRVREIIPSAVIVHPYAIGEIWAAAQAALNHQRAVFRQYTKKDELPRMLTKPILRIPIAEGCTSACTFCQTRFARPFLKSYNSARILLWIKRGVENGAREIQLTAMDTGCYGIDRGTNLVELLRAICDIKGDFFVRIGMINPKHAKKMIIELAEILKKRRFYKFVHLPVQSGSEKVCREMGRGHTVKDFVDVVHSLRRAIPDITIATDIITGYPSETEKDFEATCQLLKNIRPDIVNLSKFSPRPGTKAKMLKQLPTQVIAKRSRKLSKLIKEISTQKNRSFIGKTYDVLITERQKNFTGRNSCYKQVVVKNFMGSLGDSAKVKIIEANHCALFGKVLED